jgi:hypothetical protein
MDKQKIKYLHLFTPLKKWKFSLLGKEKPLKIRR